uniref:PER70 n=1 Tax=Arundo donax TaxID=35708 RepID=A0A0A8ZWZ0_ARUDO
MSPPMLPMRTMAAAKSARNCPALDA